jgi:replicative DNA helicase
MLNAEQRNKLELEAIKAMLIISQVFDDAILYDNLIDLFRPETHKQIVSEIYKQFVKTGKKPTPNDMLIILPKDLRNYFVSNISTLTTFGNEKYCDKLHGDNLESETRSLIRDCETLKYKGKDFAESLLTGLTEIMRSATQPVREVTYAEAVDKVVNKIMSRTQDGYIPTNFNGLDLFRGGITIIAARPSQGKTALMLSLNRNLVNHGKKTITFSIEMPIDRLIIRDLSYHSKFNSEEIEKNMLNDIQLKELKKVSEEMKKMDIIYIDSGKQSAQRIIQRCKKQIIRSGLDVVFIDYLTLMKLEDGYNKNEMIENTLKEFREFAKECNVSVVILSQLNRQVEQRPDKRPILADLRDSGSIEQDAETIWFLFRPAYYFPDANYENDNIYGEDGLLLYDNYLEIIKAKARGGAVGIQKLEYKKEIHRIGNTYDKRTENNMSEYIEKLLI